MSDHTHIPGFDLFLHLDPYLTIVLDHSLFVFLAVEVFSSSLRRTVLQEDPTVFAVKLLAHKL